MVHSAEIQAAVTASTLAGATAALRPRTFFVAWNGVIALVYNGFPKPLAAVKSALSERAPTLRKENFGSKWPKTTLGALDDAAPPLTLEQLCTLKALCEEHGAALPSCEVLVGQLSCVTYSAWRSLERPVERVDLPLPAATPSAEVSAEERGGVDGVLAEWSDLTVYLPNVNAPGSRIGSYREASPDGSTLVGFLELGEGNPLRERVLAFERAVDDLLPGRYHWLEAESWHCTLRSLS